jgi:hypothetical protein
MKTLTTGMLFLVQRKLLGRKFSQVIAVLSANLLKPNSSENNKEQLINISEMYHLEIIYFINPVICLHYFLSEKCKFLDMGQVR